MRLLLESACQTTSLKFYSWFEFSLGICVAKKQKHVVAWPSVFMVVLVHPHLRFSVFRKNALHCGLGKVLEVIMIRC